MVFNGFGFISFQHRPCILVFDSLAGASRTRVVATLRDYLTCEYRAKIKGGADHTFNRFNIMGHNVKVPQQTNFTDCGLYLLQYVESFFTVCLSFDKIFRNKLFNFFLDPFNLSLYRILLEAIEYRLNTW